MKISLNLNCRCPKNCVRPHFQASYSIRTALSRRSSTKSFVERHSATFQHFTASSRTHGNLSWEHLLNRIDFSIAVGNRLAKSFPPRFTEDPQTHFNIFRLSRPEGLLIVKLHPRSRTRTVQNFLVKPLGCLALPKRDADPGCHVRPPSLERNFCKQARVALSVS